MRILVLGANGTLGRPLIAELNKRGHEVYESDVGHRYDEDEHYYKCDINEFRQLDTICHMISPGLIFNLAAEFGRQNGADYYENMWQTNITGLQNIIYMSHRYQSKLIHFSSSEVYGDYLARMTEETMDKLEIKQLNEYALSKWTGEQLIRMKTGNYVIIRPFNVYGPGERYSPYRSVNIRFLWYAHHGIPFDAYIKHSRTFTYIDDFIRTVANIPERFKEGQTYNIAGNEVTHIGELADIAIELTGCDPDIVTRKEFDDSATHTKKPSIDKAIRELYHNPVTSIREGMAKTYEWMKKEYKL